MENVRRSWRTFFLAGVLVLTACNGKPPPERKQQAVQPAPAPPAPPEPTAADSTAEAIRAQFVAAGLVDVQTLESTIAVDLKYGTTDNFMGEAVYGNLCTCWLQPAAAEMLAKAQAALAERRPGYRLVAYDCARPQRAQFRMWESLRGKPEQRYVASPWAGSMHNFGCSVDVGLLDSTGAAPAMGTAFDAFDSLAQPRYEQKFLDEGRLTPEQLANRRLLREVMLAGGWRYLLLEWWHFEAFRVETIRRRYVILK